MKAQDIMAKNPTVVTPETTVREAARLMQTENVGMLPVVRSEGSRNIVGVITDRDITIRHVAEGHASPDCQVREAMSSHVKTAKATDSVDDVMKLMGSEQVRRMPIVDERGDLVGIVAQADLVREADDKKAERTVEKISQPTSRHAS